jgi:hypothetical protein
MMISDSSLICSARTLLRFASLIFFITCILSPKTTSAAVQVFLPTADGSVYYNGGVNTINYVVTSNGDLWGDIHFANSNFASYRSINLELSVYGLPFFGDNISIYFIDNATSGLSGSDYSNGVPIGSYTLPLNLSFGEQLFFDVAAFVHSARGSYFAFVIRADGTDVFSSTNYNLGTPPELIATSVPEMSSLAIWSLLGTISLLFARRRFAN